MAKTKYDAVLNSIENRIKRGELKNGDKMPTEADLTAEFGVSRQTVRKALGVLMEKEYVRSIQGSGYYVTYGTRSPEGTRHIAVITTTISDYIFPSILRNLEYSLSAKGYTVSISATNNSVAAERNILKSIRPEAVSGIIVEGTKASIPNPNLELYLELADAGVKIIFFNSIYPGLSHPNIKSVEMDDRGGGVLLTNMLIDRGHSRIGAIFKTDDLQGPRRYSGYIDVMARRDLLLDDRNILWFNTESRFLEGVRNNHAAADIEAMCRECTAIVCYNDQAAAVILNMLDNMEGHTVTAVYSFDNYNHILRKPGMDFYSIGYPREAMGRLLSEKLLNMLDGAEEKSVVLPWETR